MKYLLPLFLLLITLTACQPAPTQPIFTPSADATATPIPIPSAMPKTVATLPGVIWSFDVSPDLRAIAFATSKGLVVYDFNTYALLRTVDKNENIISLAWSPDGKQLGASFTRGIDELHGQVILKIWDTATWKLISQPTFGEDLINERILDIAWSPDGTKLAISTDVHGVMVLDLDSGEIISHQTEYASSVQEISWSPDGSRLVSTGDMAYSLRRWKVSDDESVRLYDQRVSNPWHVAWSPDGARIASGHVLGTVCLWTAATNKCDGLIQAHRSAVFSLAWSPDGKQLATGGGVIRIWDTQTGKLITAFGENEEYIYTHLVWASDERPIITLESALEDPGDTRVRFWNCDTGMPLIEFQGGER
jgi:WD40 repeat protein